MTNKAYFPGLRLFLSSSEPKITYDDVFSDRVHMSMSVGFKASDGKGVTFSPGLEALLRRPVSKTKIICWYTTSLAG